MKAWRWVCLALACIAGGAGAAEGRFEFALIGDTPYSDHARGEFVRMLAAMGKLPLAFIIHDGDFKDGASACSDALFADRLALFNASAHPFVFVPGDNEWTDCHRLTAGGFDPEERLEKLREMFFAGPSSLGRRSFALTSQASVDAEHAAYREHLRWQRGPVLFLTLNLPGSRNNIGNITKPSAEYLRRSAAVRAWIEAGFALARSEGLRGLVLVMQADPDFAAFGKGRPVAGYADFLQHLTAQVKGFSGEVLLVHGDNHKLTIDKPLRDPASGAVLQNFTRVQTFGHPYAGWVRVSVDAERGGVFEITPRAWAGE